MLINLPNGKTVSVSYYEWLFLLDEDKIDEFYSSCLADDLGEEIDNPFSNSGERIDLKKEEEE